MHKGIDFKNEECPENKISWYLILVLKAVDKLDREIKNSDILYISICDNNLSQEVNIQTFDRFV